MFDPDDDELIDVEPTDAELATIENTIEEFDYNDFVE